MNASTSFQSNVQYICFIFIPRIGYEIITQVVEITPKSNEEEKTINN